MSTPEPSVEIYVTGDPGPFVMTYAFDAVLEKLQEPGVETGYIVGKSQDGRNIAVNIEAITGIREWAQDG